MVGGGGGLVVVVVGGGGGGGKRRCEGACLKLLTAASSILP